MTEYRSYCSHDTQSRCDEKIMGLMLNYGHKGYSWYWCIIEILRDQTNYSIRIDTKSAIANITNNLNKNVPDFDKTTPDKLKQFIKDCCFEFKNSNDEGLFSTDKKSLWSESLNRRMQKMKDISSMRSEFGYVGAASRWREKHKKDMEKLNENSKNGKIAKAISNKDGLSHMAKCVKESKVNKSKVNKRIYAQENKDSKMAKAITDIPDNVTAECNFAFETWNNFPNIIHTQRLLSIHQKRYDKCIDRLGGGDEAHSRILLAIKNYGLILASPDKYFFGYKWTFEEFLMREKSTLMFGIPTEDCLSNFTRFGKVAKNAQATNKYGS